MRACFSWFLIIAASLVATGCGAYKALPTDDAAASRDGGAESGPSAGADGGGVDAREVSSTGPDVQSGGAGFDAADDAGSVVTTDAPQPADAKPADAPTALVDALDAPVVDGFIDGPAKTDTALGIDAPNPTCGSAVACKPGDGCCPPSCDSLSDSDCTPKCDNGVKEKGEECDPISKCEEQRSKCMSTRDIVRKESGSTANCTFLCKEEPRTCGDNTDNECPSGCTPVKDRDCREPDGQDCGGDDDCKSGHCAGGVCCNAACSGTCESCKVAGKVGMCVKTCDCKMQSPQNLVLDAGLDTLRGWSEGATAGEDATGCPGSFSVGIQSPSDGPCFPVPAFTRLAFGAMINPPTEVNGTGQAECELRWYKDTTCGELIDSEVAISANNPGWQKKSAIVVSPANAVAARINCHCWAARTLFDNFFLSPPPNEF